MPGEGRDQRGRDEPREEDEPDGLLAADVVRVDGDGDEERVVADDRRRPGELEPAQVRVAPDGGERGERVLEPPADPAHGAQHLTAACLMKDGEGRFPALRGLVRQNRASSARQGGARNVGRDTRPEDEVEAHGPTRRGPDRREADRRRPDGRGDETTSRTSRLTARLAEGPTAEGPTAEGPTAE